MKTRKKLYYRIRWVKPSPYCNSCTNSALWVDGWRAFWVLGSLILKASRKKFGKVQKADERKGRLYLSRRHRKQGHPHKEIAQAYWHGFNTKGLLWLYEDEPF